MTVQHRELIGNCISKGEKHTDENTIEIMHMRQSNYTVYFSFKMLHLQLNTPSEWLYVGISKVRHITVNLMTCTIYSMVATVWKALHKT